MRRIAGAIQQSQRKKVDQQTSMGQLRVAASKNPSLGASYKKTFQPTCIILQRAFEIIASDQPICRHKAAYAQFKIQFRGSAIHRDTRSRDSERYHFSYSTFLCFLVERQVDNDNLFKHSSQ